LQPVDVILRRMDDGYCDPVELRGDSYLGTPGLTNAVRTGNVAVANPLGSGVLENPALSVFMPALSKHLLGEDIRIPSVPGWWCGERGSCEYVLANLQNMVIKPIHPSLGFRFVFGAELDSNQLDELRAQIRARPHRFVGQEAMSISTVPVLVSEGLQPRHTVLRSFLVADEQDYMVMPGGLTRVSSQQDKLVVSNQAGGISKDTWVLATEPEKYVSLLSERRQARLAPSRHGEVPGRVADNLFWVGRYAERAEFNSRLLRLTLQFIETGESEETGAFRMLLTAVTRQTMTWPGFGAATALELYRHPENELLSVLSDQQRSGSLAQTVNSLLRAVRSVRDRLSSDTWRVINEIDEELRSLVNLTPQRLVDALDELDNLVTALTAFSGLTLENMTRGSSWRFLDIGRRLERALQTTRLLQSALVDVVSEGNEILLSESMLTIVDSLMSYRRRYRQGIQIPNLLELVVYDESNPRSLAYQMSRLEEHVANLPQQHETGSRTELERLTLETATLVRLADVNRLALPAQTPARRETLEHFLGVLSERLPALSDQLTATYFRTVEMPHQLVQLRSGMET
jgi:uncharacterized alpha-E superfamily protein